ncbi:MAG: hypothetical protein ACC645_15470 [Pirellulales bacterium]
MRILSTKNTGVLVFESADWRCGRKDPQNGYRQAIAAAIHDPNRARAMLQMQSRAGLVTPEPRGPLA